MGPYLAVMDSITRDVFEASIEHALSAVTPRDARGWFKHCGYRRVGQLL